MLAGCQSQVEVWNDQFVGQPLDSFISPDTASMTRDAASETVIYTIPVRSPVAPVSQCDRSVTVRAGVIDGIRSTCLYDNI